MKFTVGIIIHALLIGAMLLTGYTSLVLLACFIPELRFLPGYDQDPLGAFFAIAFRLFPCLGIIGLISLLVAKPIRIPLLTGLASIAYPAIFGLLIWATDSSPHGILSTIFSRFPESTFDWANLILFLITFVLILMGTRNFIRNLKNEHSQQCVAPYVAQGAPSGER